MPDEAPNNRLAPGEALAAVNKVLDLLGRKNDDGTTSRTRTVLPSGKTRAVLETFAQAGTIAELDATQPNMKALMRDLLDWRNAPGEATRANGNVIKAAAQALQAKDENGNSAYPQAVEMLGFVAALAPLLQGDRLARIIAEAPKVTTAYAPDRYTLRFYGALAEVLTRYPEQRREQLAISLWHTAHEGRFWDITSGVTAVAHQGNRARMNAAAREARAAADQYLTEVLAGADAGSPEAHTAVIEALFSERLPFNEATVEAVRALPPSVELSDRLVAFSERMRAGDTIYPDQVVLCSVLPWAKPTERPESPLAWVAMQLASALRPDRETGAAPLLEKLPDKPKSWRELFPNDVVVGFPHPAAARRLDGVIFPGTTDVQCRVVKNTAELVENRDFMGNCTYSYKNQMEQGRYVLLVLQQGGETYNASLTNYRGGQWGVGEVNSRFNRGNVPQALRAAVEAIAAAMPPLNPETNPTGSDIEARARAFSMLS